MRGRQLLFLKNIHDEKQKGGLNLNITYPTKTKNFKMRGKCRQQADVLLVKALLFL